MSRTPLIDKSYTTRTWVPVGDLFYTEQGPGTQSQFPPKFLNDATLMGSFNSNSELAMRLESQMAQGQSMPSDTFLWDMEVLAANLNPDSGGQLTVLTADEHGYPKGTIVMTVFEATREGNVHIFVNLSLPEGRP